MRKLILISLMVVLLIVPMGCGKPEVKEMTYGKFDGFKPIGMLAEEVEVIGERV